MTVIGVDTGGTFSDLVHFDEKGQISVHKVPSTPDDFARGVFDVTELARERLDGFHGAFYESIDSIAFGSTIATNTVVTRSGAKVGLITTRGHGDMLSIMRVIGRVAGRPLAEVQTYAATDKPQPLVPKPLILEVDERIDWTGEIVVPLNGDQVVEALDCLVQAGIETIAVSFLWGFLNPIHEHRVAAIAQERHPKVRLSLGSSLATKMGEYERTEAAVANAYIAPVMARYLDRVGAGLRERGLAAPLFLMHSSGGVGTEAHTREKAVTTLYSGPAGGVIAAKHVGEAAGFENIICTDVGGTTFDVGLVVGGRPLLRTTTVIDQRTMYVPTIDIVSIGAGGGSLAESDEQGRLVKVGPGSAGADPGPACYGRGGTRPTVTDANVILGYIDPDRFLGGEIHLDRSAAERAIREQISEPLGVDVTEAAAGIFTIVNAKMADLVRKVTVERGYDPREFVLCAYGGLGPLHAPFYGWDLGVKAVMVPLGEVSSVFSAYGIAMADIVHVFERSHTVREPFERAVLAEVFKELQVDANEQLAADDVPKEDRLVHCFVDLRYVGQVNELTVQLSDDLSDDVRARFETQYVEAFGPGSAWKQAPVEIVGFRIEAIGMRRHLEVSRKPRPSGPAPEPFTTRPIYWPPQKEWCEAGIYNGGEIGAWHSVPGPAVLEFSTTTVLVPPEWRCECDAFGNLMLADRASDHRKV